MDSSNLSLSNLSDLVEETAEEAEEIARKAKEKSKREEYKLALASHSNAGKWHILQEFLIEIQADGKLKEGLGQKYPTFEEQLYLLHKKVEVEFKDDPNTIAILNGGVTHKTSLQQWTKLAGWNDAVIDKMKSYGLFTPQKRAEVIEAVRSKAVKDGDTAAAKVWLTMSGDYSDKVQVDDQKFEKYKEYINSLNPVKSSK